MSVPRNPRLLHVFATFAPGGPQVRTCGLIEGLGSGWEHAVLAMDGNTGASGLLPPGERAAVLEPIVRGGSLATVARLARLLRRERFDLLLTYNWGAIEALAAARLVRAPAVLHHEDGFRPDELRTQKRRRVLARRLLLRRVRGVVVPSRTLARIAAESWRVPDRLVRCIPNGIRTEDYTSRDGNRELRGALGIPAASTVVGTCGHLRAEKCPGRLLQAVAAMRDRTTHLLLVGDGPERADLDEKARTLRIAERVHLVGHQADPRPYLRAMDVFALSSDTEQMPVALLEAMACELPVASTDVGDVRAMLPGGQHGFLVPLPATEDARPLAGALDQLASDAGLRSRLGAANRGRVVERYGFGSMLGAYRDLYACALEAGPRPPGLFVKSG